MYRGRTVGVVVPAYNEEGRVGEVIDTIPAFVDRVYVVDDCSTDDTWAEIQRYVANRNRALSNSPDDPVDNQTILRVDGGDRPLPAAVAIRHDTNRGVGRAITTGYRHALDDGIDVTAVMAGDGQMDPDILDRILDPVVSGAADYAKGDRFGDSTGMPRFRFVGNVLLTLLTKLASGYWTVRDPQNGYTAISRSALEELQLDDLYRSYGFLNDLLMRLNARRMRVADVPMGAVYGKETSDIAYSSFIPKVSVLFLVGFLRRLWTRYVASNVPEVLYPLGLLGALTATACLLAGLLSGAESIVPMLALLAGSISVALLTLVAELRSVEVPERTTDGVVSDGGR